jgi:hypothetical protein
MVKKALRYASAMNPGGTAESASNRDTASSRLSPIMRRIAASSGMAQSWAVNASRMQETMACWLSTKVPSQSKTTRRNGLSAVELGIGVGIEGESQKREGLLHVTGQRSLHLHDTAFRMRHADCARVQVQRRPALGPGQYRT